MLRRTKAIRLEPDNDDLAAGDDESPVLPQRPSIEALAVERRSGSERRSSEEVRTEFQRTLAMAQEHGDVPSIKTGWTLGTKLRIGLVVLALLAGGAAAWLATQHPAEPVAVAAVAPAAPTPPPIPTVKVLVAAKAIGLGERLSGGAISWQDWPQATVQSSYITDANTPDAMTTMAGAVAKSEFVAGEPVLESKVVKADGGYLSAVLDNGMRGVSVSVSADSASGGFIVPNDHVDVVLTRVIDNVQHTATIVSNVRVLAINAQLGQTGGAAAPDPNNPQSQVFTNTAIATLELNPVQAETIVNALSDGKFSLILRSLADSRPTANADEEAANQAIRLSSPFWTKSQTPTQPR